MSPARFQDVRSLVDFIFEKISGPLRLATPLGLGKPNRVINAVYDRVLASPERRLEIYTALSLDIPDVSTSLEKRFLGPFLERHFGKDYPRLRYVEDLKAGQVPERISIHEFYLQAGTALNLGSVQRNYISQNYTHAGRMIVERKVNLILQMVARRERNGRTEYSLSCNPDLTLDVLELFRMRGEHVLFVGVVNDELPFVGGDAVLSETDFDALMDGPEGRQPLFALPREPVSLVDHWVGLHASRCVEDGGTLQIGIGTLSEALTHALLLRHQDPETYRDLTGHALPPFQEGLYGTSELVTDAFMHLRKAGILKRRVKDLDENRLRYLHGAFYLGSKDFYAWLRALSEEDFDGFSMTRVSKVNDLYDSNEWALRRQRKKARFFNTCMKVSLLGGAASDCLEDGRVVSGVGGQYNFVSMAHELEDGRSLLLLRSSREDSRGRRTSNIVWSHAQLTIPRHLRDIVVTEYGSADLRGASDEECVCRLIEIADAEFQEDLIRTAHRHGKLSRNYVPSEKARRNRPEGLKEGFSDEELRRLFPRFPFGSDFSPEEERLATVLSGLRKKRSSPWALARLLGKGIFASGKDHERESRRMGFHESGGLKSWLEHKFVLGALESSENSV